MRCLHELPIEVEQNYFLENAYEFFAKLSAICQQSGKIQAMAFEIINPALVGGSLTNGNGSVSNLKTVVFSNSPNSAKRVL